MELTLSLNRTLKGLYLCSNCALSTRLEVLQELSSKEEEHEEHHDWQPSSVIKIEHMTILHCPISQLASGFQFPIFGNCSISAFVLLHYLCRSLDPFTLLVCPKAAIKQTHLWSTKMATDPISAHLACEFLAYQCLYTKP